jgi:uncharacterized membrane protein (DUF2068 family)
MRNVLIDRLLPVLTAVAFAVSGCAIIHYLQAWYFTISTSVVIIALGFEVARLRKLLESNGVNPRPNRRFQRQR